MACMVREEVAGSGMRAITLQNELLAVTVLPEKGADIYRLTYLLDGIDVLWKSPWGLREPGSVTSSSSNSEITWLDYYEGGWQVLCPNGGDACQYQGAELTFHGEASTLPWTATVEQAGGDEARLRLAVRLARSPLRLERTMRVQEGQPSFLLEERITNEGAEPLALMWSHHPAFGAPFLSPTCRIDCGAGSIWADPAYDTPGMLLQPGGRWTWPMAAARDGTPVDLRQMPTGACDLLAYLGDFAAGWYAITNPDLGFGVALAWPATVFPHAWLWQELRGSRGYPWYGSVYTMAIEPASSVPGHGLLEAINSTGTHLLLAPGESREVWLRAAFYAATPNQRVGQVDASGQVTLFT